MHYGHHIVENIDTRVSCFFNSSFAINATMTASSLEWPTLQPCKKSGMFLHDLFSLNIEMKNNLPNLHNPAMSVVAAGPVLPLFLNSWYPFVLFRIMGARPKKHICVNTCLKHDARGCTLEAPTPNRSLAVFIQSGSMSIANISTVMVLNMGRM